MCLLTKKLKSEELVDTVASASFISEEHVPQSAVLIPDLNNNIRNLTGKIELIVHI